MNKKNWNEWTRDDCSAWTGNVNFYSVDVDRLEKLRSWIQELWNRNPNELNMLYGILIKEASFPRIPNKDTYGPQDFAIDSMTKVERDKDGEACFGVHIEVSQQPEPTLLAAIVKKNYPDVKIEYCSEPIDKCDKPAIIYEGDKWDKDDAWHVSIVMTDHEHGGVTECLNCVVSDVNELAEKIKDTDFPPLEVKDGVGMWQLCRDYNRVLDDLVNTYTDRDDYNLPAQEYTIEARRWIEKKLEDSPFVDKKPLKDFDFKTMKNKPDKDDGLSKGDDLSK